MRITTKGQVTIPAHLREKAGLLPHTEVEFAPDGKGGIRLFRAKKAKGKSRGEKLVEQMRRFARAHPIKMSTEEIMALTRSDD